MASAKKCCLAKYYVKPAHYPKTKILENICNLDYAAVISTPC